MHTVYVDRLSLKWPCLGKLSQLPASIQRHGCLWHNHLNPYYNFESVIQSNVLHGIQFIWSSILWQPLPCRKCHKSQDAVVHSFLLDGSTFVKNILRRPWKLWAKQWKPSTMSVDFGYLKGFAWSIHSKSLIFRTCLSVFGMWECQQIEWIEWMSAIISGDWLVWAYSLSMSTNNRYL
jgi:hypothetical protein